METNESQNDIAKIPTKTIELFSWNYLKKHPKTQPIIKKYFGKIGAELFINWSREFCNSDNPEITEGFIQEIDQISPKELIETRYSAKSLEEASEYIYSQPYWFLIQDGCFVDSETEDLVYMFLTDTTCEDISKPAIWQDAQIYLRALDKRLYCIDEEAIQNGKNALNSYRAKYAMKKLGRHGIRKLLERFFDFNQLEANAGNFIKMLNKALGEDIQEVFLNQTPIYVRVDDLGKFDTFFEYPGWIEFTPEANDEIIRRILHNEMTNEQIDFYLGAEHKTTELYRLYPTLKHILKTTNDDHLFWKAGDMLAIIWRLLPDENKKLDKWFNKELYDIFWSRIEDVNQIKSYQDLALPDDKKRIFDDALGWIVNNPNLKALNPELWSYLEELAKSENISHLLQTVLGRVCVIHCQNLSPTERYKFVSEYFYGKEFYSFFSRPETIEETKNYLEICQDNYAIISALEALLIEYHSPEVQDYIYQYIIDNFEQIYAPDGISDIENILKMFESACSGVTTHTKLLDELKLKCLNLANNMNNANNRIEKALEYANHNINYREFQTQLLVKNFRRHIKEMESN